MAKILLVEDDAAQRPEDRQRHPAFEGGAREVDGFVRGVEFAVVPHHLGQGVEVHVT